MPWWISQIIRSKVGHLHHALVYDGVLPSLTDHQIGPLDDNDGHEECRVTRELKNLTLRVRLQ